MDLFLPILGGTIFVGLMFGVFKKDGYNHNKYIIGDREIISSRELIGSRGIVGDVGRGSIGDIGRGNRGIIGTVMLVKPGGIFQKDGKEYIIYPEYIELRDGKWIPDGRNWENIYHDNEWKHDGNSWKYIGKYDI